MAQTTEQDNCNHWGLTHWLYGIKEYTIDRGIFCANNNFDETYEDRTYRDTRNNHTSDCCCVWLFTDCEPCCFNNPVGSLLCLPFALPMHLLCLPYALYGCKKEDAFRTPVDKPVSDPIETSHCVESPVKNNNYPSIYASRVTTSYNPRYTEDYWGKRLKEDELHRQTMHNITMNNINWNNSPFNPTGCNRI